MWVSGTKATLLLARGSPERRFVPDIEFLAHPDRRDWNPGGPLKKRSCRVVNHLRTNYRLGAAACPAVQLFPATGLRLFPHLFHLPMPSREISSPSTPNFFSEEKYLVELSDWTGIPRSVDGQTRLS